MNPLSGGLLWKLQKNRHLFDAMVLGRAPDFVARRRPPKELGHIPVITFHVAIPERFEEQCAHVANNRYHTLDGEEFKGILSGKFKPRPRSIVITFDDGLKQVWTVAYPILKKYGLRAIVFLVPGCIAETEMAPRKTLEDVWAGEASEVDIMAIQPDETPLATWPEIREMHESGVIDFQSHTMWHSLVPRSEEIIDFGRPDYSTHYFGNIHVPLYQRDGLDVTDRDLLLGMPIYSAAPRMQVAARYFDDQGLRDHCIDLVARSGGGAFFSRRDWRQVLQHAVESYRRENQLVTRLERPQERDEAIERELRIAKETIENRLPGKKVEHLCFPWYKGADFAQRCAERTGHALTYCDYEPGFLQNNPGSQARRVARVDETFMRRLPGAGRMTKLEVLQEMIKLRELPGRMFPAN